MSRTRAQLSGKTSGIATPLLQYQQLIGKRLRGLSFLLKRTLYLPLQHLQLENDSDHVVLE
jgi:hypothetical protein